MLDPLNNDYENTAKAQNRYAEAKSLSEYPSVDMSLFDDYSQVKPEEVEVVRQSKDLARDDDKLALYLDIPLQVVGGVRDAAHSVHGLAADVGGVIAAPFQMALGLNEEERAAAKQEIKSQVQGNIPEVKQSERAPLQVGRKITQFASVYALLGRLGGAAGASNVLRGIASDFIAFDEHEKRLVQALKEDYGIELSITDWLEDKEGDGPFVSRLKTSLEGAGIGFLTDAAFKMFRVAKGAKTAQQTAQQTRETIAPDVKALKEAVAEIRQAKVAKPIAQQADEAAQLGLKEADLASGSILKRAQEGDTANLINAATNIQGQHFDKALKATTGYVKVLDNVKPSERSAVKTEWMRDVLGPMLEMHAHAQNVAAEAARPLGRRGKELAPVSANTILDMLTNMGDEGTETLMRALSDLGSSKEVTSLTKQLAQDAGLKGIIAKYAAKPGPARAKKIVDRINTYYLNSILSNIDTIQRDIIGNVVYIPYTQAENMAAAALGKFKSLFTGEADRIRFEEGSIFLKSAFYDSPKHIHKMLLDGWRGADGTILDKSAGAIRTIPAEIDRVRIDNLTRFGKHRKSQVVGGLDELSGTTFGRALDAMDGLLTAPTTFMQGKDDVLKAWLYGVNVKQRATAQALKEGLKGDDLARRVTELVESPVGDIAEVLDGGMKAQNLNQFLKAFAGDPETAVKRLGIQSAAVNAAQEGTFMQQPTEVARAAREFFDVLPGGRFMVPFITTIDNLTRAGARRTPILQQLMPSWWDDMLGHNGQRAKDLAQTQTALGVVYTTLAWNMALEGSLTGGSPKDKPTRDALNNIGWRQNSVLLNDKYVDIGSLSPLNLPFIATANLVQAHNQLDGEITGDLEQDLQDLMALTAVSTAKTLGSMSWGRSLAEIYEAFSREDGQGLEQLLEFYGTSLVPNAANMLGNWVNPTMQEAEGIIERVQAKVGMQVRDRLDVFGDPISKNQKLSSFAPFRTGPSLKDTPRWKMQLFEDGAYPSYPDLRIGLEKLTDGVEISIAERNRILQIMRDEIKIKDQIKALVENKNSPYYALPPTIKGIGTGTRADLIKKLYREAAKMAEIKMISESKDLQERIAKKSIAERSRAKLTPQGAALIQNIRKVQEGASNE